ncbi:MAG: RNA methyltransferase [Clostridia bacterium]|nr:RNA methyltransferase [Clostridia bacterium]
MKTIISKDNPKIKYVSKLLLSSSMRKSENCFVVEGLRLCNDALLSDAKIIYAFFTADFISKYENLCSKIQQKALESFETSYDVLKKISSTKTPQGVVLLCECFQNLPPDFKNHILMLENIQNPLNMGTIFRTAEAFGINDIIITGDCCDAYSPKVTRGSMGAIFRLNINFENDVNALFDECKTNGIITCASSPNENSENILNIDFSSSPYLMAIGNEANGLTQNVINLCDKTVTIPMKGNAESLNAATSAAVLMWEMTKSF